MEYDVASLNKKRHLPVFIAFSSILFFTILVVGSIAFLFSMRQIILAKNGNELTKMLEVERIKLETSVNHKITIATKMAESPLIMRHFTNPQDSLLREMAIEEIGAYRDAFKGSMLFWISDADRIFYADGAEPYVLNPDLPENYWYNMTLYETHIYNFNINYNPDLNVTNLWINAPVFNKEGKPVGMLGVGIDLSEFINELYKGYSDRITLYLFNASGEITGAEDVDLIIGKKQIQSLFGSAHDILSIVENLHSGQVHTFDSPQGKVAVGALPALEWYSLAIMSYCINDYKNHVTALFLVMLGVIALILIIFNMFISHFLKTLHRTMDSLEAASKYKSEFLATMSHEIRTPMNAIIGITQIELQQENTPKRYAEAFNRIYGSGKSLLGIINDILDMSKIETGKLELNPSEYDTPSLINDAVQLNVVRIGQKPIKFELEVDENLPSRIYGDELRLKQILNNLLSNAIKYTFEGRVKLSVKHSCIDGDNVFLHFIIEDTGQGMKPEDQARLFSEYLRFNSGTNRTTEGTGLGLNITKKLVLLMGGNIEAESEYGKGSKFTVSVKQKAIGDAIIGKDVAEHLRTFTFSDKKTDNDLCIIREEMPYGNVLVVDDVDTNLYVAQGLMAPYKLKAEMVESGFAAIDKVKAGNVYDIIFMDHMMPNMDGVETTEKIRGLGYTAPIVALTANALVGNDEIFAQKGFDGFISKPIDIRQLNVILNKFIRDRHREEAKKYKPQAVAQSEEPTISAGLLKVFCRDAEKVIVTLHQALADGNTKLFAITAHAIKSALANIGENEAAQQAFMLEKAGLDKDMEFINGNTKNFTEILQALIKKLAPANDNPAAEETDIEEDKTLLAQQLDIIKTACEDYDDSKVYAALDLLKAKQWKRATCDVIESIHEALYLCSDFEEAAKLSEMLRKGI